MSDKWKLSEEEAGKLDRLKDEEIANSGPKLDPLKVIKPGGVNFDLPQPEMITVQSIDGPKRIEKSFIEQLGLNEDMLDVATVQGRGLANQIDEIGKNILHHMTEEGVAVPTAMTALSLSIASYARAAIELLGGEEAHEAKVQALVDDFIDKITETAKLASRELGDPFSD